MHPSQLVTDYCGPTRVASLAIQYMIIKCRTPYTTCCWLSLIMLAYYVDDDALSMQHVYFFFIIILARIAYLASPLFMHMIAIKSTGAQHLKYYYAEPRL